MNILGQYEGEIEEVRCGQCGEPLHFSGEPTCRSCGASWERSDEQLCVEKLEYDKMREESSQPSYWYDMIKEEMEDLMNFMDVTFGDNVVLPEGVRDKAQGVRAALTQIADSL